MTISQTSPSLGNMSPDDATAHTTRERAHRPSPGSSSKMKHLILPLALLVVMVMMVMIRAAIRGEDAETLASVSGDSQPAVSGGAQGQAAAAGIGTKVRDGTFEFVVTGVERPGKSFPGKLQTTLTAGGEFVIVRVDVTNVGDEARRLDCQCQYLLNDKGQAISPSSRILYTKDALKYVELIYPGVTVIGAPVVFDVAPETLIVNIELHGSSTSQGVRVRLS